MAQAAHAANALVQEFGRRVEVKVWQKSTDQGFGTTIVLAADHAKIYKLFEQPLLKGFPHGWVVDPDYAIPVSLELVPIIDSRKVKDLGMTLERVDGVNRYFLHRKEHTCAYLLGSKEFLAPFLGEWSLY